MATPISARRKRTAVILYSVAAVLAIVIAGVELASRVLWIGVLGFVILGLLIALIVVTAKRPTEPER
jgi:hypothetical protein